MSGIQHSDHPPGEEWPDLWHYSGTVVLASIHHDHEVVLDGCSLQETVDYWTRVGDDGEVVHEPGLHYWGGSARVSSATDTLIDLLGGELLVVLPDGTQGHAYATGDLHESTWLITITGVGPPPHDDIRAT